MLLRRPRCAVHRQGPATSTKPLGGNSPSSARKSVQTWQTAESAALGEEEEEEPLSFLRSKTHSAGPSAGKGPPVPAVVQRVEQYVTGEMQRLGLDPSDEAAKQPSQPQRIQVYRTALALLANDIPSMGSLLKRIMQEYDSFIVANCQLPQEECAAPKLGKPHAPSRPSSRQSSSCRTPLRGVLDGLDDAVPAPPQRRECVLVQEVQPPSPTLPPTRLLEVEVVEACDVVRNAEAAISAYVSLQVGDVHYKTGPRQATLKNPVWKEKFLFLLHHDPHRPMELHIALHDRLCDLPLASSALQLTAAMLDQWARLGAPEGQVEAEWDTRDVWLPLRDAALGPGPEVHLRFSDQSRQTKWHSRLPITSASAHRMLEPKALYTLCKGCLVMDKLRRDGDIHLDSLKQVGLKDKYGDMQRTIEELKGYIRLFLRHLEDRQEHVERLEVEVQRLKARKRDLVCVSVYAQTDSDDQSNKVQSTSVEEPSPP